MMSVMICAPDPSITGERRVLELISTEGVAHTLCGYPPTCREGALLPRELSARSICNWDRSTRRLSWERRTRSFALRLRGGGPLFPRRGEQSSCASLPRGI